MPRIPRRREGQRISAPQPVQLTSPGAAGAEARALQEFGGQLQRAGRNISAFQEESNRIQRTGDVAIGKAQSERALLKALEEAKDPAKGAAEDGSNLVERFEDIFDRESQPILDQFDDSETRKRVQAQIEFFKTDGVTNLSKFQQTMRSANILSQQEKIQNLNLESVRDIPELFDEKLGEEITRLDESRMAFDIASFQKIKAAVPAMFAKSAIDGYIARGNDSSPGDVSAFDDGLRQIDEKFSTILGPKETQKQINRIRAAKLSFLNEDIRQASLLEKQDALRVKQLKRSNNDLIISKFKEAKNFQDRKKVFQQAELLKGMGLLDVDPFNYTKTEFTEEEQSISTGIVREVNNDLFSEKPLSDIRDKVDLAQKDGRLTRKDYDHLVSKLMKRRTRSSSQNRLIKRGETLVKRAYGKSTPFKPLSDAKEVALGFALFDYEDFLAQGLDPERAARSVIRDKLGDCDSQEPINPRIIPLRFQRSSKVLDVQGRNALLKARDTGQVTDKEYAELIDQLDSHIEVCRADEILKRGKE